MDYEMLVRFLLAALWGGIVGCEREYRSKSAGFRTMIMISIGSCFFTMMSVRIGGVNNSDRIASNILTGIGFLGAGVIFRGENRVNGITTAATIWAVAAIGMGIGAGYYFAAAMASLLIVVVLAVLPYLERVIDHLNQLRIYTIQCEYTDTKQVQFEQLMKKYHLRYSSSSVVKAGTDLTITWQVYGHLKNHQGFIQVIMNNQDVKIFEY